MNEKEERVMEVALAVTEAEIEVMVKKKVKEAEEKSMQQEVMMVP